MPSVTSTDTTNSSSSSSSTSKPSQRNGRVSLITKREDSEWRERHAKASAASEGNKLKDQSGISMLNDESLMLLAKKHSRNNNNVNNNNNSKGNGTGQSKNSSSNSGIPSSMMRSTIMMMNMQSRSKSEKQANLDDKILFSGASQSRRSSKKSRRQRSKGRRVSLAELQTLLERNERSHHQKMMHTSTDSRIASSSSSSSSYINGGVVAGGSGATNLLAHSTDDFTDKKKSLDITSTHAAAGTIDIEAEEPPKDSFEAIQLEQMREMRREKHRKKQLMGRMTAAAAVSSSTSSSSAMDTLSTGATSALLTPSLGPAAATILGHAAGSNIAANGAIQLNPASAVGHHGTWLDPSALMDPRIWMDSSMMASMTAAAVFEAYASGAQAVAAVAAAAASTQAHHSCAPGIPGSITDSGGSAATTIPHHLSHHAHHSSHSSVVGGIPNLEPAISSAIKPLEWNEFRDSCLADISRGSTVFACIPRTVDRSLSAKCVVCDVGTMQRRLQSVGNNNHGKSGSSSSSHSDEKMSEHHSHNHIHNHSTGSIHDNSGQFLDTVRDYISKEFGPCAVLPIYERRIKARMCNALIMILFTDVNKAAENALALADQYNKNGFHDPRSDCYTTEDSSSSGGGTTNDGSGHFYYPSTVPGNPTAKHMSGIKSGKGSGKKHNNNNECELVQSWFANAYFIKHIHFWSDFALKHLPTKTSPVIGRHCRCQSMMHNHHSSSSASASSSSSVVTHNERCFDECCCCLYRYQFAHHHSSTASGGVSGMINPVMVGSTATSAGSAASASAAPAIPAHRQRPLVKSQLRVGQIALWKGQSYILKSCNNSEYTLETKRDIVTVDAAEIQFTVPTDEVKTEEEEAFHARSEVADQLHFVSFLRDHWQISQRANDFTHNPAALRHL